MPAGALSEIHSVTNFYQDLPLTKMDICATVFPADSDLEQIRYGGVSIERDNPNCPKS